MAVASVTLNSGQCDVHQNYNFHELLIVKPHDLLIPDQIWVVESDWSLEIKLKLTCARPFSYRALAPPSSGLARKGLAK